MVDRGRVSPRGNSFFFPTSYQFSFGRRPPFPSIPMVFYSTLIYFSRLRNGKAVWRGHWCSVAWRSLGKGFIG